MEEISKELQDKIQELQILEQNLQNLSLQKQAFQLELNETELALKELSKSNQDSYKIIGQIMIKSKPEDLIKELQDKKKILDLRLKTLEKQDSSMSEKSLKLREEIQKKLR